MEELDISKEEMDALVRLGIIPEELAENRRQSELAEALRYGAGPEGRQAGRVYVAANPLEHIARGAQRFKAAKEMKKLGGEREGLISEIGTGREMFGNIMMGRGQMGPLPGTPSPNAQVSVSGPENFPMPSVGPITAPKNPMADVLRQPSAGGISALPRPQGMPAPQNFMPPGSNPFMPQPGQSFGTSTPRPGMNQQQLMAALLRARGGTNRGMMM